MIHKIGSKFEKGQFSEAINDITPSRCILQTLVKVYGITFIEVYVIRFFYQNIFVPNPYMQLFLYDPLFRDTIPNH